MLVVLVDGQFHARIELPDGSDQWDDWFTWQEEGIDWRRHSKPTKRRKVAAGAQPSSVQPGPAAKEALGRGGGKRAGAAAATVSGASAEDHHGSPCKHALPPGWTMTEKQSAKGRPYKIYYPPHGSAQVRSLAEAWRAHRYGETGVDAHAISGRAESETRDSKAAKHEDANGGESRQEDDDGCVAKVGDRVLARFKGRARWYPGVVCAANADGTFAIDYDDGDQEKHVLGRHIRPPTGMYAHA